METPLFTEYEYPLSPNDVKAVSYDSDDIGGANQIDAFDTGFMDIATLSREHPISAITGIDTLSQPVFYRRDGREIPDPRIYLEDIE